MIKTMEFIKKHCFKEESDGKHECIFCCEKTNGCILFDNCKHIFMSCFCCKLELKNKCPICRKIGDITDAYLCTSLF